MVRVVRFELTASWSLARHSSKLSYTRIFGDSDRTRTGDLLRDGQADLRYFPTEPYKWRGAEDLHLILHC